ncbi:hypothetical protein IU449_27380 [Nocardia higoensis]|uniref:Uncharacterized protein n=1 Tax=Nocardia higoensis TaxID=228599 RepID=A0ABS0DID1_9NOCA|nr:hypothetical protein [Nocardia higoensis]MBF6358224.1 hypothetical protein [Nocardia higoensis]
MTSLADQIRAQAAFTPPPGQMNALHELADKAAEVEAERDQFKAGARELGLMLQKLNEMALDITDTTPDEDGFIDWQGVWESVADLGADLAAARAVLARVNAALATHPRCDVHPDDDAVSCGWKRAVASVQGALDSEADRG